MNRDSGDPPIWMAELLVGAALTNLLKAKTLQNRHHLAGLEDWWLGHRSGHDGLDAYEFRFEFWLTILKQQRNDFL
jgi:hypothetical protein